MPRIANRDAYSAAARKENFNGSNLFGESGESLYVVYSYGYHFPLLAFDRQAGAWFYNIDKYSRSTSKHQSQVGRHGEGKDTKFLRDLISAGGIVNQVAQRMGEGVPA